MTYKQFESSIWVNSFNEKEFPPDHRFYKLIESELDKVLNSDEVKKNREIDVYWLDDDPVGCMLYLELFNTRRRILFNTRGRMMDTEYGKAEGGHNLLYQLYNKILKMMKEDDEVNYYTSFGGKAGASIKEKIMKGLHDKTSKVIDKILLERTKEAMEDPEIFDKYKNYIPDTLYPEWANRSKKTGLWDYETRQNV